MKRISMRLQDGLLTGFSGKKVSPKMPTLRPGVQLSEALSIFEIPALRAVSEEDRQGIISKLTPIVFDAEAIAIQQGDSDAPKQIIFFIEGTAEVSLHLWFPLVSTVGKRVCKLWTGASLGRGEGQIHSKIGCAVLHR